MSYMWMINNFYMVLTNITLITSSKKRENDTIAEIHSDLRHVTIAQHFFGGEGLHDRLVSSYNVAVFYYCFALVIR